jgi:DNA-binding MarR family transcriptional regulator
MSQPDTDFPHDFVTEYLGLIAQYIPGDTTLNQIRILHYIDMRTVQGAGYTSHTEICVALRMSAATVTRAIASFIEAGIIREDADELDGRRRLVRVSKDHVALAANPVEVSTVELC